MFTARHRSLPPTRTEDWTIEDRPRRLVRPVGIRKALGCRQAGRVQGGPPQSGPGRPARILAELRKCLRAGYVGTSHADTITRVHSFGIGQSPARAALAMASGTGIGPPEANGGYESIPAVEQACLGGRQWVAICRPPDRRQWQSCASSGRSWVQVEDLCLPAIKPYCDCRCLQTASRAECSPSPKRRDPGACGRSQTFNRRTGS